MDKKIVAFGYIRKSPDDKEDTERSLNNQKELIETICKGKDWILLEVFSDKNISGGDRDREGVNQCIKKAKEYKVSNPREEVYILVKDQDRFARDSSFLRDTLKDLDVYGVLVFSVIKNGFLDYKDLGDSVMSLMNEQLIIESKKKAEINENKKIEQKLPCIPAPFGYKYNKKKNWSIEKNKVPIIINVLKDYVNGIHYNETLIKNKITRGKRDRIISNAKKGIYNGVIIYNHSLKDLKGNIIKNEVKYKGTYQPIISEELYNKVNNI